MSLLRLLPAACFLAVSLAHPLRADTPPPAKILFFSKSSGFEHPVVKRTDGKPSMIERTLDALGAKHNIVFTHTKDGSLITREYLAQFDAFFFYATGDLTTPGEDGNPPMTPEGKQALLDAVASGKGFIGTHSAADAFHGYATRDMGPKRWHVDPAKADPFIKMLGGEFIKHDKEQKASPLIIDAKFPGVSAIPKDWVLHEEWYSFKNYQPDLHVILAQNTAEFAPQPSYARPNYPIAWARLHDKGRVYYLSLGHRADVWANPVFQTLLLGGIDWALRRVDADVTPNLAQATPGANTLTEAMRKSAEQLVP